MPVLTKCLACDTPALLLGLTGQCGTDDESIPCPFATDELEPDVEDDRNGWHADRAADRYERTVLGR
jgi:hypothetical protein